MAAGSFDDILAITGFSTCLGIAFSKGLYWNRICFCSVVLCSDLPAVCPFRFYVDEHSERSAGGGGRDHCRAGPGSVLVLPPQQRSGGCEIPAWFWKRSWVNPS